MTAPSLLSPSISVDGAELSMDQLGRLTGANVEAGLRIPARAVLKFNDSGYVLSSTGSFSVGKAIKIKVGSGVVLFDGIITGVGLEQTVGRLQLSIVADDPSVKLTMGNRIEAYVSMSVSDIVTKIAQRRGLTADVDSTPGLQPYTLQSDSDFDFLNQLADRVGYDWWAVGKSLKFKKPTTPTPVKLTLTEDLTEFTVKATGLHPSETTVSGWDPAQKRSITGQATASSAALKPDAALVTGYVSATQIAATSPVVVASESPNTANEAQAMAAGMSQRWTTGAVTARGIGQVNGTILPGGSVKVDQAGPASGTYFVTFVEHVYTRYGFQTRFTAGERRPTSLVDTLSQAPNSSFNHLGLLIGVVTQNDNTTPGEVIGRKGDVKVKFVTAGDQVESQWARVATIGGGKTRGITFMPEIDDEVIVGFEGGDPRRPIVLGGVYNGKDSATEYGVNGGKVASRRLTSRKGHVIEMKDGDSDADDMVKIDLKGGGSHMITLGTDAFDVVIPSGKEFSIMAGDKGISLKADGTLTLKATKIVLDAQSDVEINGANVKAKAKAAFEASGAQVSVKGSGTGEVSASGPLTLKGAIVQIN
ncbi:hypothetical protein D1871_15780 [Nakamurella silvestris]|nr:hypothetical protein D1871_15780 [Nakamurella silvestris]